MTMPSLAIIVPALATVTVLRYLLAAGIMAAVVAVLRRRGRARVIQTRRAGTADVRREIRASLRTCLVFAAVGVATVAGDPRRLGAARWRTPRAGR